MAALEQERPEVEVKLTPPPTEETILGPLREYLPQGWRLIRARSYTVTDTYVDFAGASLLAADATLRLRATRYPFKKKGRRYGVQLKLPREVPDEWADLGFRGRTEVRAEVGAGDIIEDGRLVLPPFVVERARTFASEDVGTPVQPLAHIVTHRHRYTVFSDAVEGRGPQVCNLFFETCAVIDTEDIVLRELIETGTFTCEGRLRTATFAETELEVYWIDEMRPTAKEEPLGPRRGTTTFTYVAEVLGQVTRECSVVRTSKVRRALTSLRDAPEPHLSPTP